MTRTFTLNSFSNQESEKKVSLKTENEGPRKDVIRNILGYSKSLSVRETKQIGKQLMVLN